MSLTVAHSEEQPAPVTVRRLVREVLADIDGPVHPEDVAATVARRIVAEGWADRALAETLPNHVRWIMSRQRSPVRLDAPPTRPDGVIHSSRRDLCVPVRGWRARLSDLWAVGDGRFVPLGDLTTADIKHIIEDHRERERALAGQRAMLEELAPVIAEYGSLRACPLPVLRDLRVRPS